MWQALYSSDSGRLENLNQLTAFGKEVLYTFVHHLLQGHNGQTLNQPMKTYQWLNNNPNISVTKSHVLTKLTKYSTKFKNPEKNNHPEDKFYHMALPTHGACTEGKLEKAKICEETCGGHNRTFMAQMMDVSVATLKAKLGKRQQKMDRNKNPNPLCYFSQFHGSKFETGLCTDSKLEKAKKCEETCGGHKRAFMAKILNVAEGTLKNKLGKKQQKEKKNPNPLCYFSQFHAQIEKINDESKENSNDSDIKDNFENCHPETMDVENDALPPWNFESELMITDNIKYEEEENCDYVEKSTSVINSSKIINAMENSKTIEDSTETYEDNFKNEWCDYTNEFSEVKDWNSKIYENVDNKLKYELGVKSEIKEESNDYDKDNQNKLEKEGEYECEICDQKFIQKFLLNLHNKDCHVQLHQCDQCEKSFEDKTKLRNHIDSIHGGLKTFNCDFCDRKYSNKRDLENHIKKHDSNSDYEYKCDTCEKSFCSENEKVRHIYIVHKGHKSQQCGICKKTFTRFCFMKRHVKFVHEGVEMNELCSICGKSIRPDHLKKHIKNVHEGSKEALLINGVCTDSKLEKAKKCEETCGGHTRTFMAQILAVAVSTLKKRLGKKQQKNEKKNNPNPLCYFSQPYPIDDGPTKNQEVKRYLCKICGRPFKSSSGLIAHIKIVHEKDKDYRRKMCELCGISVPSGHYKEHKEVHEGQKNYKCGTCGKSFNLNKVMQQHIKAVHEGQRNHKCSDCGNAFFLRSDLRRHIDSVHLKKPSGLIWKRKKKFKTESDLPIV